MPRSVFVVNSPHCSRCGRQGCACGRPRRREQDLLPELTVNSAELDWTTYGRDAAYIGDCLPLPVMNYGRDDDDDDEDDYPASENRRRLGVNRRASVSHQDPELLLDEPTVNYAEWSEENRRQNGGHGKPISNRPA